MDDFTHRYGAGRPMPTAPSDSLLLPPTLKQYKKHADKYGPDQVYETAIYGLALKDLIELVHHLRALPSIGGGHFRSAKVWSLTKEQREDLGERMQNAGYTEKAIQRVTKG